MYISYLQIIKLWCSVTGSAQDYGAVIHEFDPMLGV